jgi:hypothetical protein
MFDLEQAVSEWRREMRAAGIMSSLLLDELECHLRDDLEERMTAGTDARQALGAAVHRVGPAIELRNEFQKAKLNQPMKQETYKLLREILLAIAVLAVGLGLVMPAVAKLKEQGSLARFDIAMLLVGTTALTGSAMFGAYSIANSLKQRPKA